MHTALTLISLVTGIGYIVAFAAGFWLTLPSSTLRRTVRGIRLIWLGVGLELVALVAHLIDNNYLPAALNVATALVAVPTLRSAYTRRRLKGDQVIAEAERAVRDWRTGQL